MTAFAGLTSKFFCLLVIVTCSTIMLFKGTIIQNIHVNLKFNFLL